MIMKFIKKLLPLKFKIFLVKKIIVPAKIKLKLPLKKVKENITFEIHVAEHCNLNCCGCDHFSPLADPEFVNINEFKRDMVRMGEIFSHKCKAIYLLGGEPLLNPEITELMKIVRDNFSKGDIRIVTNGLLLLQQGKKFWEACRDNNVGIEITHYPIKLDFERIKSIADEFGVDCQYRTSNDKDIFIKKTLDLSGSCNEVWSFGLCDRNGCTTLEHGRLYICSFIPHVHIFNKKFYKNIPVTEHDYIDIYQDVKAEDILKRLTKPVPACRYCDITHNQEIKWHESKREISEWI